MNDIDTKNQIYCNKCKLLCDYDCFTEYQLNQTYKLCKNCVQKTNKKHWEKTKNLRTPKVRKKKIIIKKCKRCGDVDVNNFSEKVFYICKKCQKIKNTIYYNDNKNKLSIQQKEYYNKNKGKILEYNKNYNFENKNEISIKKKTYRKNNKEKIAIQKKESRKRCKDQIFEYSIKYREKNREILKIKSSENYYKNRERYINYSKLYYSLHKEKILEYAKTPGRKLYKKQYSKNKIHNDIYFKLHRYVSISIAFHLRINDGSKHNHSCLDFLPYTIPELKQYLESLFEPWMSWDNHKKYNVKTWNDNDQSTWTWNLDHIIPQSDLPYDSMEHFNFLKCWDLPNLRPYSAKQNIIDGGTKIRHAKKVLSCL